MVSQGEVLSVAALIHAADTAPAAEPEPTGVLRHTAAQNASTCRGLLADGENLDDCWRFGILQTLDDYTSALHRGGPGLAAGVFTDEPPRTGAAEVDAAFAALAEYLAERDGWQSPHWAHDSMRRTASWYPAVPAILHGEARRDSPEAFRRREILITSRFLARA